jgi:hypothetical protein
VATSGSRCSGEAALDPEIVEALRNDTTRAIVRESAMLPDRERTLVLGIVRQFEAARSRGVFRGPVGRLRGPPPSPAYSPAPS